MSCGSNIPDCAPCQDCPPSGVTYNLPDCPQGEKCEEVNQADCLAYKGPHLPAIGVLNNDRLSTILAKIHKKINEMASGGGTALINYTVTCTPPSGTTTPFKITYLGTNHQIMTATVVPGTPQTITAFPASVVVISGQGTVV